MASTETGVTPYIDPRRAGLLVIDMQEGFCHPDALMETSGIGTSNQRAIIPDVVKLVALARERDVPVFWSQQVHFPEDVTRERRKSTIPGHMDKQNFAPCLRGTWEVAFVPEMDVREEDFVVEKHRASMFFETTLSAKLRMLGIEQVIVCGVTTEFCCETTIRDAYYRDMDVIVVRDCVAGPYPRFHEDTLAKVETFWGAVVSLEELPSLFIQNAVHA
jgi:ureidoacrylate peracid hydrolase